MNAADTAFLAALVVALWAVCRDCYGRGKVLTMPLRRRVRLFDIMPLLCRFTQNISTSLGLWWIPRTGWGALVFWGVWVAPYVDDLLTGDDDRWKRWKDAVGNAVRWLMELPARPEPETA